MVKQKVFIISHSHWDREWYMGYEQHHMRLIDLMDDLFHLFETDPDFDSFHLDGQTIILDDYLKIRPDKRAELAWWIKAGKLRIGPFYILQDDFLISPEANVRNTQYGLKAAHQWGQPVPLGYFPDTFGNMGQTAQMMQLAGLDTVAFGRGVTPTGLNNQVGTGDYDSTYSEMWWQGPDQSRVLGILFANWYSNGNEIPVDPIQAKRFWDQGLAKAQRFAATPDLLFMNGVDHQPVQQDITQAIRVANELYPDYEFIHSNFADYIKALKADLPADLSTIRGELTSQATNGWYTLANTASSRVYLKQQNMRTERLLENQVEPLLALSGDCTEATQDKLDYAWQVLLQNHPHDSICGCSIDPVHARMLTRFAAVQQIAASLTQPALQDFANQIDTTSFAADAHPFVLMNNSGAAKQASVQVEVEIARALFKDGAPQAQYDRLTAQGAALPQLCVVDESGQVVPAQITNPHVRFNYTLPKHTFRVPYMALYVDVTVAVKLAAFGWQTLAVQVGQQPALSAPVAEDTIENAALRVRLEADHSVSVYDKRLKRHYPNALVFEDTGDIGNEYIYRQSSDHLTLTSQAGQIKQVKTYATPSGQAMQFDLVWELPIAADERLDYEQQAVIDVTKRKAQRSKQFKQQTLQVTLTLDAACLEVRVTGDNGVRDHRLQAVIATGMNVATHDAESIFEVVKRANTPSSTWQNPTNPQHQQAFVSVHDDLSGIVVGNLGLNEYEVGHHGETIALTLLRCVGEMGDWGYFATPDAQCLGQYHADFSMAFTDGTKAAQLRAMQAARAAQIPVLAALTDVHPGQRAALGSYLQVTNPAFAVTAIKQLASGHTLVRGYNMTDVAQPLTVRYQGKSARRLLNLVDEPLSSDVQAALKPAEIRTLDFE
ncbi:alpha-mannosidase [Lacticaseibacillus jixiensis]|uniref:alpha-mannosidase n=1 Tax=Lacticaseibacillus jixiensis TaxID=3231926 RepID=UPI0036F19E71